MATQGTPNLVIANAGVSIGIDSAVRADLDLLARTLAVNNVGLAASFHPFIEPMRQRGSGPLVGTASMAAIRGLPGTAPPAPARPAACAW